MSNTTNEVGICKKCGRFYWICQCNQIPVIATNHTVMSNTTNRDEIINVLTKHGYPDTWQSEALINAMQEYAALTLSAHCQEKDNWVSCVPAVPLHIDELLKKHPHNLIICHFDNGYVTTWDSKWPFAELTSLYIIPQPPNT